MKFLRRRKGDLFFFSLPAKAIFRMCRLDCGKSTFVVARKQICQKGGIENRGFAFQPLPFQQKGHTVKANRRNSLFPHYVPYGLRQFGHVRVCVPVETVHTVGILHIRHRYGDGGEDTSVTSLLKKVTKVHDVYLFRLGVVPVYTGRGRDATPKGPGNFCSLSYTRGGNVGYVLKGVLKRGMYGYALYVPYALCVPVWVGMYCMYPYVWYVPNVRFALYVVGPGQVTVR